MVSFIFIFPVNFYNLLFFQALEESIASRIPNSGGALMRAARVTSIGEGCL